MPGQQTPATPKKKTKKIKVTKVINGVDTVVEEEVEDTEGGPEWGPNNQHTILNKRLRRVDAPVKVSGAAQYTYDVRPAGMLHARILCAPHANARVTKFDPAAAKAIAGVRAVIDARPPQPQGQQGEAAWEVLYHGQPVAAVAATTPEIAEDAIRAIVVEYEARPHVVKAEDAVKPDAPRVAAKDPNVEPLQKQGDLAKVEAAFKTADVIVEGEYRSPKVHHASLETHGHVVDYRGGNEATIYASTQGTFTIPGDSARELGLPESNVTAIVEYMGGGFGSKFGIGIEGVLACRLAKETKTPIKLMLTRRDEFVAAGNRSGSWQNLKAGARRDGTLVAFQAMQRRLGGLGDGSQAGQPYIYSAETFYREVVAVHTNEDSSRAMRAPGHPQASFAMEALMEELAAKLEMDPLDLRKKNLKDQVYHRQLDRGAKEIGWERRNKTPGGGTGTLKRGIGCGIGTWGGGGNKSCNVELKIGRDGGVVAACGTQDLGTGTRTFIRAIVAEELGLTMNDVLEKIGNSKLGSANPSGGSTTVASLSPAVKDAAFNARKMMVAQLASLLNNAKPEEVKFAGGKITGGGKTLTWKQACAALPAAGLSARGEWKSNLAGIGVHGAAFAEVEVDTETGHVKPIKIVQVQDMGLPLNRVGVESQVNGGIIQS
ncbi:MAG TPA: xanthine dehydrogenase family protein molybdopterin-binding subunit, partial [Pyrinomonadaceae bacterium]|nr:xanthine dehydrogenase family protein molybdopterin-binding subunit [Pyrinomonadaceae bacterium]